MLSPLSWPYAAVTAWRMARPGERARVPVLCCGNATVGGAGKTTLTMELARRLTARGLATHVLSRGYGGSSRGPHRVTDTDSASTVGDEALLLGALAPTWTGADRAVSARAAVAAGAEVLVMDDGLQNPTLEKTMSLLVIDGATGFGNGRVLPMGPLREPVEAAASRCRAAVIIGADETGARTRLPPKLPVLRAALVQDPDDIASIHGGPVLAFAGIAMPDKFFMGLERAGVELIGRRSFPDHHVFARDEIARLSADAKTAGAVLVTTPKDAVRLPRTFDVAVVRVRLAFENEKDVDELLDELLAFRPPGMERLRGMRELS